MRPESRIHRDYVTGIIHTLGMSDLIHLKVKFKLKEVDREIKKRAAQAENVKQGTIRGRG